MLVDPEEMRDRRRDEEEAETRTLYPIKTAQRTTTCPYCLALIEPGMAIAIRPKASKYAHLECAQFEDDLANDPTGTRKREQAEWRRRIRGERPKPITVPPFRRRKKRSAV